MPLSAHYSPTDMPTPSLAAERQVRFLSQNRPGPRMGMGHYERLLLRALQEAAPPGRGWRFEMRFAGRAPAAAHANLAEMGLQAASFEGYAPGRLSALPWPAARAAVTLSHRRLPPPDLFHSLALSYPAPAGRPAVYTIHDLPPAHFADEGTLPRWARDAAQAAAAIVTPSEFARQEIIHLLGAAPARVHVVPNGYERDVFHADVLPASPEALAARGLHGPFLLYAGGATQRKNVPALLQAWRLVAPDFPHLTLALAGPAALHSLITDTPRTVSLGYLERVALPGVLRAAAALVCPSIYEGFGLPPLEAMALGVPVVGVRAGAVPEVVGDCAVLAENGTPAALADALRALLSDDALAARLRQGGPARADLFSWPAHARRVLEIYRLTLDGVV